MSSHPLLKLTLLAGMDVTALSGTFAGAADETPNSSAAASAAAPKQASPAGKSAPTVTEIWGRDYAQAWRRAKKLNRPVLLHFHATWCGACRQMERDVLNTPIVLRALDASCVAVKIDCDEQPALVQRFGIESLPCDVLVTPDRKIQYINHGFMTADEYSSLISRSAKPKSDARVEVSAN
jgi:thioredoxin-like negative regulator of GroEL